VYTHISFIQFTRRRLLKNAFSYVKMFGLPHISYLPFHKYYNLVSDYRIILV